MSERRKKWLKRLAVLLGLAVVVRIVLPFVLQPIARSAVAGMGLELEWEELDMNLHRGEISLAGLSVRELPADGAEVDSTRDLRVAQLDTLSLDVDTSRLLTGDIAIRRVEVDGLDVFMDRDEEGVWSWMRFLPTAGEGTQEPQTEEPKDEDSSPPEAIDLRLPISLEVALFQNIRLHVRDEFVSPAVETRLELDLEATDFGTSEEPGLLRIRAHAPGGLDVLRVEGTLIEEASSLALDLACQMSGFHPLSLAGLLAPLGLTPKSEELDLDARIRAEMHVNATDPTRIDASAHLERLAFTADGQTAVEVETFEAQVNGLFAGGLKDASLTLSGVEVRAAREADGTLVAGGFGFGPTPASPPAETVEESAPSQTTPARPFDLGPATMRIEDVRFVFDDAARPDPFELVLASFALTDLTLPASGETPPAALAVRMNAPRLFEALEIEGQIQLTSKAQNTRLEMTLDGLYPEGVASFLEGLPWRPAFGLGQLRATLAADHALREDGGSLLNAELGPFVWKDTQPTADEANAGDAELARLDTIAVRGLELSPTGDLRLAELEIAGGRAAGTRDAEGVVLIGGFENVAQPPTTEPRAAAPTPSKAPSEQAPAAPQTSGDALPSIEIGRIHWHDTQVSWQDAKLQPPLALDLEPFAFELTDLAIGVEGDPAPAKLRFDLGIPGLLSRFQLDAEVSGDPEQAGLTTKATIDAEGIDLDPIAEYLALLGIEPRWKDGGFSARLQSNLRLDGDDLEASLTLAEIALSPEGEAGPAALACASTELTYALDAKANTHTASVRIDAPTLELARDADGTLRAAGLRFVGSPAGTNEETAPPVDDPASEEDSPEAAPTTSPRFRVESLVVEGFELGWSDAVLVPPLATRASGRFELSGLSTAAGDPPAAFQADLSLAESLEKLSATGTIVPDPQALQARADVQAIGLRAGPLARYLPPGTESLLGNGELKARAELDWTQEEAGGSAGFVRLVDTRFQDGEREWFALGRLAVELERFDPAGAGIVISDVACEELTIDSALDENGRFELMGLAFGTADPEENASEVDASVEAPHDDGAEDELADASVEAQDDDEIYVPEEPDVLTAAARPTEAWPEVLLRRMHLGIAALRFHDRSSEGTEPLTLALVLSTPENLTLTGPEPEELPPLGLTLSGSAEPILGQIDLTLTVAPYLPTPTLDLAAKLGAINGASLTRVLPALAETLDASAFEDGEMAFRATGALHARRRSPIDFDFSGGFGLDGAVEELSLRTRAGDEPLASLGTMTLDVASVRPSTGDIHVRTLELYDPMLRVAQEADGLRVAGLLLRTPAEPGEGTEGEGPDGGDGEAEALEEPVTYDRAPEVTPEFRVDQLLVQGLDFRFEDGTVDPPTLLPLDDLEIEVRRFTTRALEEPRPVRFRANLGAGDVPLIVPTESGNILSSLASEVGSMIGAGDVKYEERPLFDEIAVGGSMTLFPKLTGWAKVDVHSLELGGFRGAAAESGVDLAGGVLDGSYSIRFLGDRGAAIATKSNFFGLDVSEPESGPIEKFLGLPAPLGSVLYLLKDANGELKIPLAFKVGPEGVSTTAISTAAAATLLELIARAITDSPFRIVEGALDLTGLDFSSDKTVDLEEARRELMFAPGSADLTAAARAALDAVVPLLRQDRGLSLVLEHHYAKGDLERAEARANPTSEHLLDLVARLRGERAGLWRERDQVASEARAAFATGAEVRAEALRAQLIELDTEVARCENALDEVAELLRPGAERRKERRTRVALRALASERLDTVRSALIEAGVPAIRDRVRTRRPRVDAGGEEVEAVVALTPRRRKE